MTTHFIVHDKKDTVGVIVVEDVKPEMNLTGWIMETDETIRLRAKDAIPLGHKIALADLHPGDLLVKYGETIGEATAPIARGGWVHVHNLRSLRARPDARAVAFDAHAYVDVAAAALALSIPAESRDAVAANLTRLSEFAREVLAFDA